ncbi:MAG: TIGR02099 family protein [Comamonadaceae bacterium]|nr:MAG: TIGR02099 family protein [Comamonadaceae bacterium]
MTETPPHPTRLLKFMAGFARWSLTLLLAFWLLLAAAWGVLHGWIVPRIGDFRPQLEAQAGRALGVPVRIGQITAHTEGLVPSVELGDVALLDAQGREALRLSRVVVAVSPRSLLKLGFEQLYIEGPELDVRRERDGRIFIAGLAFRDSAQQDSSAADWLFSQTEVAIRGGTLRWTDELRGAPPLALTQVDLVLRNGGWKHAVRLDATPPPEWGDRFTVSGQFRQPLLTTHGGAWQRWSGQLYADFSRVDVSRLNLHADVGADVQGGHGALRAWVDVQRGEVVGGTADVALAGVNATLGPQLQPLAMRSVAGRLGGQRFADGFEFSTHGLQFVLDDGMVWPGGNLTVRRTGQGTAGQEQGELRADRLDLAALAQIASRLPVGDAVHGALGTYAPQGLVNEVQATWRGPLSAPQQYHARGTVTGLALAAQPSGDAPPKVPGLRGASVEFDLTQAGGKATLAMADGALLLPQVFEDAVVPVDRLGGTVRWQIDGDKLAVQASDLQFANADAQGEARFAWQTADPAKSSARSRFPGVLDLSGVLNRADGTRVHRYLPLAIPDATRHYVRDAVTAGSASQVQFRVKGDLHDMPFNRPAQGEFRIAAKVKGVTYAYVPPTLQHANELPWPALTDLQGELIFDRSTMAVKDATGSFAGASKVRVQQVNARIPDLAHTVVGVVADVRGPLGDMLAMVGTSHIGQLLTGALDQASATGPGQLQLNLSLPISHIDQSKVQGTVTLAGNDVRITPDTPTVARARGAVQFTETGFTLAGVQGQALGGDVRLEGGMKTVAAAGGAASTAPTVSAVQVRASGVATAEGLRQASQMGLLSQIARSATGSTPYALTLGVRRGVPEVLVTTSLQGMALSLPAPLGKPAETSLPVRFETQLLRESVAAVATGVAAPPLREQMALEVGGIGSVTYIRDLGGAQPRVLRGAIAMGLSPGESAPMPASGVVANVQLADIDVQAWESALQVPDSATATATATAPAPGPAPAQGSAPAAVDYLPSQIALRAHSFTMQGRTLHNVVVGASRDGAIWRANLDANELSGYVEYRQGTAGDAVQPHLFARLARLSMPQAAATQVDALLDDEPASTLPSLDIVVQDFELRGRRLGRIEIEAQNRGGEDGQREWRLGKFNLIAPEATLTSSGNWAMLAGASGADAQRRTVMNFRLDIRDSGDLLARFGMADVVRRGKGRLEGQIAWMGAPISPDYRSMTGQMNVSMESGQFLKADPGLAKLLSVLSLQSLPRRFTLDFRDVFSEGFAFDFVRGDVRVEQGVAITNNLQMKGVNAAVLMEGRADIDRETQDLHVVVVPEINAMTASLVATAINPVIGLGSFLAQVFLRGPLVQAATQEFRIDGTWTEPRIERISRRKPAASSGASSVAPQATQPPTGEAS